MGNLFENFYVSLGATMYCICLLKCQRFAQSLWHLMLWRLLNLLVNDLSVVKKLFRFYFSVSYALCIEKNNDKTSNKTLPSYPNLIG